MSPLVSTANFILSSLTVAAQAAIVPLLAVLLLYRKGKGATLLDFVGKRAILFSFIVALTATLGSLFYSEIAGFEPCRFCWFQRIFMYPQAIILGLALWKRDRGVGEYSIALSAIGAAIAGYHYLLQRGVVPESSCDAVGYSVSCSRVFVMNFGYITIPLMAFTAFLLILLLQAVNKTRRS